ncbi:DDX5, partial [Symbiodinium pilosum]
MTGGPFSCWNSTPYVESLCLNLTNADIQSQIEVQVSLACSRLCPLGGSLDPTCFLPPTNFQQAGSRTLTIYPFTAVGTGLISGGQLQPMFILLHPLVRHATVEFTYVFQMTQAAPFFFGLYDSASGRRNQDKAYTAVVNQHEHVKHFFAPDEKVLLSPVDIIRAAGREWNVETLMLGAEFYAEVNCYSDGYDLSASMDWSNFTYVAPTPDVPLCIMTVEQLQGAAVSSTMDGINDVILSQSRFRIDTGRGSSHHRMPSVSAILLNLISLFVLLKVPQAVTMLFAHMCLGSLSKVYKRASEE